MQKLQRIRDFKLRPDHMERDFPESLTQPDEAMSIQDILSKHVRGINMESYARLPSWDDGASFDSEDLEKVRDLDLYDKQQIKEKHKSFLEKHKKSPPDSMASASRQEGKELSRSDDPSAKHKADDAESSAKQAPTEGASPGK